MNIVSYKNNKDIRKEVEPLFVSAFPEDERPPVKYFFASLQRKENNLFACYENTNFIGFFYTTIYKDICYIFFLAIKEEYRNQDYGTKLLKLIEETYKNHVLLLCYEEVDHKYLDYENRCKRERFYANNGFIRNSFKTDEYGVIFQTAYKGKHAVSFEDYVEIFCLGFGERSRKNINKVQ